MNDPMHLEILPQDTKQTLILLDKHNFIKSFYLAGGTALALHLGHRISADLDFFSQESFDESLLTQKIANIGNFQLEKKSDQTVIGILNNVKLSFLGYKYPLLAPLRNIADFNINIADVIDIACMKIDTISARGAKRDFIDIYFVAKEIMSLKELLEFFKKKYASLNYNLIHIKKSLMYFEDAESEPMPKMIKPINWREVKSFFEKEVARLV